MKIRDLCDPAYTPELAPKTPAQRKRSERQRKLDAGLSRLEIWAHPADHAEIQAFADAMQAQRKLND